MVAEEVQVGETRGAKRRRKKEENLEKGNVSGLPLVHLLEIGELVDEVVGRVLICDAGSLLEQGDLVGGDVLLLHELANGFPDLVLELVNLHDEVDDELPHDLGIVREVVGLVERLVVI